MFIINMAVLQNFEVMFKKCNVLEICTSGNYAQNGSLNYVIITLWFMLASHTE